MRVSIDLKKEFESILKHYGHDVLVIRSDKKLRCSCYNEVTLEADRKCPICFGIGWSYTAERHTCRSETASVEETLTRAISSKVLGSVVSEGRKYFFKPNMAAKEKDYIVSVDWNQFGKPIYKDGGVWEINNVDRNLKLGQGEDVFKIVYTSENPVESHIRGIRMAEVNGILQYQVIMEVK